LAYQTAQYSGTEKPASLKSSVDIKGLGPKLEVTGGSTTTTSFTAVAALDPQMYVDALVPGDGNFEEYINQYLNEIARDTRLSSKALLKRFYDEYGDFLHPAEKQLDVDFEPRFVELGAGERRQIQMNVAWHGRPGTSTVMVVRLRDIEDKSLQTVSDLVFVGDDFPRRISIESDATGAALQVHPGPETTQEQ
jgi:hypothetical protein